MDRPKLLCYNTPVTRAGKGHKGYRFLSRSAFSSLVEGLIKDYRVYGTVKKDGFPAWGAISRSSELVLFRTPTHISAKGLVFPARETLLRFDMESGAHEAVIEADEQVAIGLHPCDIRAMTLMDRVFSYGAKDANYLARRAKTIVIGADCFPDKYCFCEGVGAMTVDEGFDLFLHAVGSGFLVRTGTERGAGLLSRYARARAPKAAELREMEAAEEKRGSAFATRLDAPAERLPGIYAGSDGHPVWERIGSICTGCGSCNNVCPTCYCFDVRDEAGSDLREGVRVRYWDGCTLEDFAKVAGGHNFRKTRGERLKHRFNRKFRYLTGRFGSLFCVGCGRCSRTCLVLINIAGVTNELIRDSSGRP
jgi:ferredoxin